MGFIIDFFEYTLSGWVFWIWFIFMIIFSLACLGVVGDKVSKKREAEAKARKLAAAEEEYRKAHELIEKQAHNSGIDVELDPTATTQNNANQGSGSSHVEETVPNATPLVSQTQVQQPVQPVVSNLDSTINSQQPVVTPTDPVSNSIPSVDSTSSTPQSNETVPNVIVLDEKTNELPSSNNQTPNLNDGVNSASSPTPVSANPTSPIDNTDVESVKTDVPAVLIINEDGTSNT